jgi:2-deoxy-D-gluconate 3-dehydrogenase
MKSCMQIENLFSVAGKTALVTGGSKGIGRMIASTFLDNGARVYITSRNPEECADAARSMSEQYGSECIAMPGDISKMSDIESLVEEISKREEGLHILINNAGASVSHPYDDYPEDAWDIVMDTNAKSPFFLIQRLLPLLRAAATAEDPARVVTIASIGGLKNVKFPNFAYGPAKAAAIHLTRTLGAHLVKENIVLNAIAPGPFPTDMLARGITGVGDRHAVDWGRFKDVNPRGRAGTEEDIGGLAVFLCSRAGAFTVGATITCDGGAVAAAS